MMSRLGDVGAKLYRGEVSVNFVGRQRLWYTISALILLVSVVALLVRGLDFSVDFKGGAIFTCSSPSSSLSQVQNAVDSGPVSGAIVQQVQAGNKVSWEVQTKALTGPQTVRLEQDLSAKLGVNTNNIDLKTVGPL